MPFVVKAFYDDHALTVTTETAKEAFAKAVEWQVAERFTDVTIRDGIKRLHDCRVCIGNGARGDC